MTLTPCADVSAAAWITGSDLPWQELISLGPSGFEAYARLRFLPDPVYPGQPEVGIDDADAPSEHELLRATLEVLKQHTRAPDDCYFCLWDGWGSDIGDDGGRIAPAFPPSVLSGAKVLIPHRAYFLFHGASSEFGDWGATEITPGQPRTHMPDPAFIWPADHAWCIANDVDPHYAGIGADSTAIAELLAHPGLDVVSADPHLDQPHYW